jgi:hypothetical protein
VERLSFRAADAIRPEDERLVEVSIAPLTEPLARGAGFQAAIFRIGPGGRIARHPASVRRLLAVLDAGVRRPRRSALTARRFPRPVSGTRARVHAGVTSGPDPPPAHARA